MKAKPITPVLHGVIDYVFSAALFFVPRVIGLKKKPVDLYTVNSINTALYSAITNYPLGIKPIISFKTHRLIDCANIGLLALTMLNKPIQKDKRALSFHISMTAAALVTVLLTDWDAQD